MKYNLQLTIIAAVAIMFAGCQSKTKDNKKSVSVAEELGRQFALELIEIKDDTLALEQRLLDIRARETRLRQTNHDKSADRFIYTFEKTLRENNDSLAKSILD